MLDNNRLLILKGSSPNRKLESLKTTLGLIQAADLLFQEGQARASAGEVAARAMREFQVSVIPSIIGQTFLEFGIGKVTIHGKSSFVLDHTQLNLIREQIASQCEETAQNLQSVLTSYQELPSRIEALHAQWKNVIQLQSRQRELEKLLADNRDQIIKTANLEKKWELLQSEAQKAVDLEKECQMLSQKIKELPALAQRKASLQASLDKYQLEEKAIAARETSLGKGLTEFKERNAWADLLTLNYNIQQKQLELDQISRQLGEKRSLLDRLLNRNKEVGG